MPTRRQIIGSVLSISTHFRETTSFLFLFCSQSTVTTTPVHHVNYVIDLRNRRQVGKEASSVAERKELVEKGNTFPPVGRLACSRRSGGSSNEVVFDSEARCRTA